MRLILVKNPLLNVQIQDQDIVILTIPKLNHCINYKKKQAEQKKHRKRKIGQMSKKYTDIPYCRVNFWKTSAVI